MNYTRYVSFKFLVELVCAVALYAFALPKRQRFFLRVLISAAVLALLAELISPVNVQYHRWQEPFSSAFAIARYMLIYLGVTGTVLFSFDITWHTAVFVSAGAYAIQHIALKIYSFFEGYWFSLLPLWADIVIYVLFILGLYAAAYFTVLRSLRGAEALQLRADEMLAPNLLMITSFIILSFLITGHVDGSLSGRLADMGYGVVCGVFVLVLQLDIFSKSNLRAENERIEYILSQERKQFESFRSGVEYLDIKCHDLKHQIRRLRGGKSVSDEVIAELEDGIMRYEAYANTGNAALDIIIGEKYLECAKNKIDFVPAVKGEKVNLLSDADIYSLFGNAIDNAIEYELKIPEDKRFVRLGVNDFGDMLFIRVENGYSGKEVSDFSQLLTTKDDKTSHGFGVKSMKHIAEKYGGEMEVETHDGVFCLTFAFTFAESRK